jgi:hypothetical protein
MVNNSSLRWVTLLLLLKKRGTKSYFKPVSIPGRPKPTSACLSHSSQAKTYLLHSNPSGQGKIDFLPSKPFQSGKNRLPHFKPF